MNPSDLLDLAETDGKRADKPPRKARAPAKSASPSEKREESDERLPLWLTEDWVMEWVRSEPPLAEENLQQYFYFSRDKVGAMAGATQRLSSRAQEVLAKLVGESEAHRRNGLKDLGTLSGADAASILDALCERVRNEEDSGEGDSALTTLVRLPEIRPELFAQVITFFENLPDVQIPLTVPLKLVPLANAFPERRAPVEVLLSRWESGAVESQLRNAASAAIKRLK